MDQEFSEDLFIEAKALYESGYESEKVIQTLVGKGHNEEQVQAALKKAKQILLEKRRHRGVIVLGIGGLLLLGGFILSAIFFHANTSPAIPLYGLTSIGIVLILFGMADCLGL